MGTNQRTDGIKKVLKTDQTFTTATRLDMSRKTDTRELEKKNQGTKIMNTIKVSKIIAKRTTPK